LRLRGREQGHVRGHPFSPAQRLSLIDQALGPREWLHRATERLHGRSWTVGRQLEHGEASGKLLLPVRHVLRKNVSLQPLPLPIGIVGILDGHLWEANRVAATERLMEGRQFGNENIKERHNIENELV